MTNIAGHDSAMLHPPQARMTSNGTRSVSVSTKSLSASYRDPCHQLETSMTNTKNISQNQNVCTIRQLLLDLHIMTTTRNNRVSTDRGYHQPASGSRARWATIMPVSDASSVAHSDPQDLQLQIPCQDMTQIAYTAMADLLNLLFFSRNHRII